MRNIVLLFLFAFLSICIPVRAEVTTYGEGITVTEQTAAISDSLQSVITDTLFISRANQDVKLYRLLANTLVTDDAFIVLGDSVVFSLEALVQWASEADTNTTLIVGPKIIIFGSDGDVWDMDINTADQATFKNASGGYLFDGTIYVANGYTFAADILVLGYAGTAAKITTNDTDEDLVIDPNGDGNITLIGGITTIDSTTRISYGTPWDLTDGQWSGTTEVAQAGEDLVSGQPCYQKTDGKFYKADADSLITMTEHMPLAIATISANAYGLFLVEGYYCETSWSMTTIGDPIYVSTTTGDLTQTAPNATGDQVLIVGVLRYYSAGANEVLYWSPKTIVEVQ